MLIERLVGSIDLKACAGRRWYMALTLMIYEGELTLAGKLYVVGTPIGNLGDMSERMADTLSGVDFIVAEDTRVTSKLLNALDIKKPMISYNGYNKDGRGEQIIERLMLGESCAIVSDAGMPCISDPGVELVSLCAENEIDVVSVPGPSALTAALSVSGMYTGRFVFEGFLPVNRKNKLARLNEIKAFPHTLVFYEAPHKLSCTLKDMLEIFGDRKICIVREITKIYEETVRTTLSSAAERYAEIPPKGEIVVIVDGNKNEAAPELNLEEAAAKAAKLISEGVSASEAAKRVSADTGIKKGDIYKAAIKISEELE